MKVLEAEVAALIDRLADGGRDDAARDALLAELAAHQRDRLPLYARLWRSDRAPAVPTDVFRFARVALHDPGDDVRVFLTSGTTSGERGRHAFSDLALYDRAARAAARLALFPDDRRMRLVILAPHPREAPESSLSYMLGRFVDWFATDAAWVWSDGALDVGALHRALAVDEPVALLGTSFAFVHALDASDAQFAVRPGSRAMQTGGFKGRSRELDPDALRRAIAERFGLPESHVATEYGMTELSSQMYDSTLRTALGFSPLAEGRRLWVPGWMRAVAVDPDTLAPRAEGELGILRLDDAANVGSACAIQTSDRARVYARGAQIELIGREPGAPPRGCSLAIEEALDG